MDDWYVLTDLTLQGKNHYNYELYNWKIIITKLDILGEAMAYKNYKKDEPKGLPYLHMNFDSQFAWDTKDDANDKDNGFICKRKP